MKTNAKAAVLIKMLMVENGITEKVVIPHNPSVPNFRATDVLAELSDPREPMRSLLRHMFTGWILHEASYEQRTETTVEATRSLEDAMTEACGGDEQLARLLCLFGHWSNDVISEASFYGLELVQRGPDGEVWRQDGTLTTLLKPSKTEIRDDVPAPPGPGYWWHKGAWVACETPDGK